MHVIRKGVEGLIFKVQDISKENGEIVILKRFINDNDPLLKGADPEIIKKITLCMEQEIKTNMNYLIESPYLIKYKNSFDFEGHKYVVMDYCLHGNIRDYMVHLSEAFAIIEENALRKLLAQCVLGILQLHLNGVFHYNIRYENILIDEGRNAKVVEFSEARFLFEDVTYGHNLDKESPYLAPELRENKSKYTRACDVFSLGMVFYEFASQSLPDLINVQDINQYSKPLNNLLKGMIRKAPNGRLSLVEVLQQLKPTIEQYKLVIPYSLQSVLTSSSSVIYVLCCACNTMVEKTQSRSCDNGHVLCHTCFGKDLDRSRSSPVPVQKVLCGLCSGLIGDISLFFNVSTPHSELDSKSPMHPPTPDNLLKSTTQPTRNVEPFVFTHPVPKISSAGELDQTPPGQTTATGGFGGVIRVPSMKSFTSPPVKSPPINVSPISNGTTSTMATPTAIIAGSLAISGK